jgi:hypothetical protein
MKDVIAFAKVAANNLDLAAYTYIRKITVFIPVLNPHASKLLTMFALCRTCFFWGDKLER